jgi:hypothetical protein
MTAEEDAAAAEAALKAELKQAKVRSEPLCLSPLLHRVTDCIVCVVQKKLKKQQKMAEWQRIKEEKQRAELEAEVGESDILQLLQYVLAFNGMYFALFCDCRRRSGRRNLRPVSC